MTDLSNIKSFTLNGTLYKTIKLLGHGKGGYSYLVESENKYYVMKQIHHEPCSYYTFGNKIEAEKNDYQRLSNVGINIPKCLYIDEQQELILKEYIDGPTIYDLVKENNIKESYFTQVQDMAQKLKNHNLNIDYFPTNFVVNNDTLYYVDYECNGYMDEWNFENWGIKYWSQTKEFLDYVNNH